MSVGEPQDVPPPCWPKRSPPTPTCGTAIRPSLGTPEFRRAALGYLERRYPGTRGRIDPDAQISPVTSTPRRPLPRRVDRDQSVAHRRRSR